MKIFIYQIISMVCAYGCNDISKPLIQHSKSLCYKQANGKIDSSTLKEAVKCCLTYTVGGRRVFGVPLMQFRKLGRREESEYRYRLNQFGYFGTAHIFDEETPKCALSHKKDLTKFFNFLDQFKYKRYDSYKTNDNRWDCFLTNDYRKTLGENNFCKEVLNTFEKNERLKDIKQDLCNEVGDPLFPQVTKIGGRAGLVLDNIEKMSPYERHQKQMVYLTEKNEITYQPEERRSSESRVFQNWNDFTNGLVSVMFDEEYECIRKGHSCQKTPVVRALECGCIPAKYSKR